MLASLDAIPTVAVRDMARATRFYAEVLGLPLLQQEEGMAAFRSGTATLLVYASQFAGTNAATAVTWGVPDVQALVHALEGRGVRFEQYEMPGIVREGAVHRGGGRSVAWCKDPDGNILCFAQDAS